MSGYDWGSIAASDFDAERRLMLLEAFERQRKRALELQAEEDARTAEPDPYLTGTQVANPAYYLDQVKVSPVTAADRAQELVFDLLSSGGAQASIAPGSVGTAVYEQLGSLFAALNQTEPK